MMLSLAVAAAAQPAGTPPFVLTPLSLSQDLGSGCSTLIYLKGVDSGDAPYLGWTTPPAKIRLNGRTLVLQVVEEQWQQARKNRSRRGDPGRLKLSGEGLSVDIQGRLTRVCTPDRPQCESEDFDGVMTLQSSQGSRSFDIHGSRGC